MTVTNPNDASAPAAVLALDALVWILEDERRADRFLGLTGLTPQALRAGVGDRMVQASILAFLTSHEPDLVACAEARGIEPTALTTAARELGA